MYLPAHFAIEDTETLHALVRQHPLGTLVRVTSEGLAADHLPFELDTTTAPYGRLRAHVARGNPLCREARDDRDVLVIFQGPARYITPAWYATKRDTGKVVPTWNYAVVHAYGQLTTIDDAEWLRALVTRLTDRHEAGRAEPWHVGDAPADYIDRQLRAIVGIELAITRLVGKWKLSQNRTPADRAGVMAGLIAEGGATGVAMAGLMRSDEG